MSELQMPARRSQWPRAAAAGVLSMLALTLAGGSGAAGTAQVGGAANARPAGSGPVPGRPVLAPFHLYSGACLGYGACADVLWVDRRPRRRPVAPSSELPAVDQDIWGTTGSPWGYVRRLPPPTAPSQIQPRYQDASTIRPEFGGP